MVSGSLALLFFLLGFHGGRHGSSPDRERTPVEWRDFPSVRTYIRPSPPLGLPARSEAQLDGRTNEYTENLPILQDFVPYRGRCPACPHENQGESRVEQGKGTADHLMPLGYLF